MKGKNFLEGEECRSKKSEKNKLDTIITKKYQNIQQWVQERYLKTIIVSSNQQRDTKERSEYCKQYSYTKITPLFTEYKILLN